MTIEHQNLRFAAGSDYGVTISVTGLVSPRKIEKASYSVIDQATGQLLLHKTETSGIQVTQDPPDAELLLTFVPADTADLLGIFDHIVRIEDDQQVKAPPVCIGTLTLIGNAPVGS